MGLDLMTINIFSTSAKHICHNILDVVDSSLICNPICPIISGSLI